MVTYTEADKTNEDDNLQKWQREEKESGLLFGSVNGWISEGLILKIAQNIGIKYKV